MIDELKVENFRCIKDLSIKDLKRINVIVGKNATGKTSLLESLFIVKGGNPEIILRVKGWRGGLSKFEISADRKQSFEYFFKEFFLNMDTNLQVSISLYSEGVPKRSVRIYFRREDEETLTIPLDGFETKGNIWPTFIMEWTDHSGKTTKTTAKVTENGLEVKNRVFPENAIFLSSERLFNTAENAKRFSELSKIGKEAMVVEAVKQEFPFIERLSVEAEGNEWAIFAKLHSLTEKIPISQVSSGVNKFLGILLALTEYEGGILLIDEIENGFYHNRLSSMLKIFHSFCNKQDTQLFITTHSMEFIESLFPSIEGNPDDFSLIRTDLKNHIFKVDHFMGEELLSVIKQGVDIR